MFCRTRDSRTALAPAVDRYVVKRKISRRIKNLLSSEPALARRGARARTLGQPEFDVDNVGFKQTNLCFLWRFREIIQEEDTQTEPGRSS